MVTNLSNMADMLAALAGSDRATVEALVGAVIEKDPTQTRDSALLALAGGFAYGQALGALAAAIALVNDGDEDKDLDVEYIGALCSIAQAAAAVAQAGVAVTSKSTVVRVGPEPEPAAQS